MRKILIIILFLIFTQNSFASFDYILGVENEKKILENKAKILDLDVLDNSENLIKNLKQKNKFLIWYINAGAIENYRDDYKNFPKKVIWKTYPGWEDERFLDIKNYKKFSSFFIKYLDLAKQKWFDAIEFDNIDTYDNFKETWFEISKQDEINFLNFLEKETHKRWLKIFQKNAPELTKNLVKKFDWAIVEDWFAENTINNFLEYKKNWKKIFDIEYLENFSKKEFQEKICPKAKKLNIETILKNRDLDEFILTCENNKNIISLKLENKINKILQKFYEKLDEKYSKNNKKILILKKINSKIEILKLKKKNNKKLVNILNIVEKNILNRIFWYNYQIFEDWLESKNNLKDFWKNKKLIAKKDKIYFWAFQYFWNLENEVSEKKLKDFENLIWKKPAFAYFSQDFSTEWILFPKKSVETIVKFWEIPFIRLMPSMVYEKNKKNYNLKDISNWKFDEKFRIWAREAKKINSPIMIDFAVEANWDWFFYGNKPQDFKKAYRHIIDIFREEKVENITWFFHFNLESFPNESWNKPKNYYPWDDYIDWIWFSLYWAQSPDEENIYFKEILSKNYKDVLEVSQNKPIALIEFWVADFNPNYKKEIWLEKTFQTIFKNPYIKFSMISVWHEKWENTNNFSDLRINSSKKSLEVYKKYLNKNIFENNLEFSK